MPGQLTTHVLDLALCKDAKGMRMMICLLGDMPEPFGAPTLDAGGRALLVSPHGYSAYRGG